MSDRLSAPMRRALLALERHRDNGSSDPEGFTSTETFADPTGPSPIHWKTAFALQRRGRVRLEFVSIDEGYDVFLTQEDSDE